MLDLVVNVNPDEFRIATLDNGELLNIDIEAKGGTFVVGDIYLGKIKNLSMNLNAAFVNVSYKKFGFLHISDMSKAALTMRKYVKELRAGKDVKVSSMEFENQINKDDLLAKLFDLEDDILVQIIKEPISVKGPRLSTNITLAGSYMILIPFSNEIFISKSIENQQERSRLLTLVSTIRPNNFGIIVRTAAEGKTASYFIHDLQQLLVKWSEGVKKIASATSPTLIVNEDNSIITKIRNKLSTPFNNIYVDDDNTYNELKSFIDSDINSPNKNKLKLYKDPITSLFEYKGIEKQIKISLNKTVYISGGAYLVIERTEAMNVIDVNSGVKIAYENHEDMAYNVNMAAAKEIAHQLRLRDMGGIIAIDFIDMESNEHRAKLFSAIKNYMESDCGQHTILPLTKFNVMLITRQRIRPVIDIDNSEICPMCNGNGKVEPTIQVADKIVKQVSDTMLEKDFKHLTLVVHPFIYAYFTKGIISKRFQWFLKYKKWINMRQDFSLGISDCKIVKK